MEIFGELSERGSGFLRALSTTMRYAKKMKSLIPVLKVYADSIGLKHARGPQCTVTVHCSIELQ